MAKKDDGLQADDSGKAPSTYSIRVDLLEAVWMVAFPVRDHGAKQWREMYSEDVKNLGNAMAVLDCQEQKYVLRTFLDWYARTYFSIIKAVAMSRFLDDPHGRLNVCHRGVVQVIGSLLALRELADFPGKFEPIAEDLCPKSDLEKAWGSGGQEQVAGFMSRAGKYLSDANKPIWYKPHGPVDEILEYCRVAHITFLVDEIEAYRKADKAAPAEGQQGQARQELSVPPIRHKTPRVTNQAAAEKFRELARMFAEVECTGWKLAYAKDAPYKSFQGDPEAIRGETAKPRRRAKAAMDRAAKHWGLIRQAIARSPRNPVIQSVIPVLELYAAEPYEMDVRRYRFLIGILMQRRTSDSECSLFSDQLERWAEAYENAPTELVPGHSRGNGKKEGGVNRSAKRLAKVMKLEKELKQRIRDARHKISTDRASRRIPEPPPVLLQKTLAGLIDVSEAILSRYLGDYPRLREMYTGLSDIEYLLGWQDPDQKNRRRKKERLCSSCGEPHDFCCERADCTDRNDGRCEECHAEKIHDEFISEEEIVQE